MKNVNGTLVSHGKSPTRHISRAKLEAQVRLLTSQCKRLEAENQSMLEEMQELAAEGWASC